jgi:hypothetical protein
MYKNSSQFGILTFKVKHKEINNRKIIRVEISVNNEIPNILFPNPKEDKESKKRKINTFDLS